MSPDRKETKSTPERVLKLEGRVLYLAKDPELVRRQINGENVLGVRIEDLFGASTDTMIPARDCLSFDSDYLGDHCLINHPGISIGDVKRGKFDLLVDGISSGQGSSREHAPKAIKAAGIRYVAGFPFETIFRKNCENIGLVCIESEEILDRLLAGQSIDLEEVLINSDPISAEIVRSGGLLQFLDRKSKGELQVPQIETEARPMNAIEKIILKHLVSQGGQIPFGIKPGDAGFVNPDLLYSYEIMTPFAENVAIDAFGKDFPLVNGKKIVFFADHTALTDQRKGQSDEEWRDQAQMIGKLLAAQNRFSKERGITLKDPKVGICHNVIAKEYALPGEVDVGTDSHTPSQGALGAFAFGIGSTELAGAWISDEVRIKVPEVWRFRFSGKLNEGIYGKDVMLYLISRYDIPQGGAKDKAFIYQGEGLETMNFDDHFVLANMVAEAGAIAGFVEASEVTIKYLMKNRGLSRDEIERKIVRSDDDDSVFEKTFDIELSTIPEMIAIPGNPRNGVLVAELDGQKIDVVYIGSCTGGNMNDIDSFLEGLEGRPVKIPTYLQLNTLTERVAAEKKGYINLLKSAGVDILDPGCGDCCNLGFGIAEKGQKVASNTNRNYEGRMGVPDVFILNSKRAGMIAAEGKIQA